MLESFLENKAMINAMVSVNNEFEELGLTEIEWKEIKLFYDFLRPFFEFTTVNLFYSEFRYNEFHNITNLQCGTDF